MILAVALPTALIVFIRAGVPGGEAVPVPFLSLYASVVLAAAMGGTFGGCAAGLVTSAFVIYSSAIGYGPKTLTGGPLEVALGCFLYLGTGCLLGLLRTQRDKLLEATRQHAQSLEDEVRARTNEVQHLQKIESIGRLTTKIAHDFNNHLGVILGNIDLLDEEVSADQGESIREARQAIDRAKTLIDRLKTFARQQRLAPQVTDLSSLLRDTLPMYRMVLPARATLELHESPGHCAELDPNFLSNAVLNLVSNASDALGDAGNIQIEVRGDEHRVLVIVRDDGHGMDEATLRMAGEPFFTTKPHRGGSGFGLASVRGFVEQSGGSLHIESEAGQGTCITLNFSRSHGEPIAHTFESPVPATTGYGQGLHAMLVEDDLALRRTVMRLLEDMGFEVSSFAGAELAIEFLRSGAKVNLIVSDVGLKGTLDGLGLVARAQAICPELVALLISANALPEDANPGADVRFLAKPFGRAEFERAVSECLAKLAV